MDYQFVKKLHGYTATVELVSSQGVLWVKKEAIPEEIYNEIYFHKEVHPSLKLIYEPDINPSIFFVEYLSDTRSLQENITPENFYLWGKAVAHIHSHIYLNPQRMDEQGILYTLVWGEYIQGDFLEGIERQSRKKTDITSKQIEIFRNLVTPLKGLSPKSVLLHCDLHTGNVLLQNDEAFIIDKGSSLIAGDSLYDLALISLSYPSSHLNISLNQWDKEIIKKNTELMDAFMEGYGVSYIDTSHEVFMRYVALRLLGRYPNPFESNLRPLIESITGQY